MTSDRHRFEIARIGRASRECFARGGRGSVLAVFHRSFYVEFDDGALACVGPGGMGAGPINALAELPDGLDWQASGMVPGAPAHVDGRCLRIGFLFEFGFASAVDWLPIRPAPGWSRQSMAAGLSELRRAAESYDLSQGFARLVATDPPIGDILIERGQAGAAALRTWLTATADRDGVPAAEARELIGLGPGLTPSGDDLIGGALIALGALGRDDLRAALAEWALPIARMRTGKISFAHLSRAADGEGAAALHEAIAGVAANDARAITAAIAGLDRIGHSSGWDALAGAVTVMSTLTA